MKASSIFRFVITISVVFWLASCDQPEEPQPSTMDLVYTCEITLQRDGLGNRRANITGSRNYRPKYGSEFTPHNFKFENQSDNLTVHVNHQEGVTPNQQIQLLLQLLDQSIVREQFVLRLKNDSTDPFNRKHNWTFNIKGDGFSDDRDLSFKRGLEIGGLYELGEYSGDIDVTLEFNLRKRMTFFEVGSNNDCP